MENNSRVAPPQEDFPQISEKRGVAVSNVTDAGELHSLRLPNSLALHINQRITLKKSSPLEAVAHWLLPSLQNVRARVAAISNRKHTFRSLAHLSRGSIEHDVVSIDFFDTLVTRPIDPPEYVLGKVAEISVSAINARYGLVLTEAGYLRGRSNCEKALRRERHLILGHDGETSLPAILERFLRQLDAYDDELLTQLLEAEIRLESELLSVNSGARELLIQLKSLNKQIIVLSDMYLTSSMLTDIAARLGLREYIDRFYVSGEIGLAKHSGRLFEHVLAEFGVSAAGITHIGDNLRSDFKVPSRLGISSKWLFEKGELRRRRRVARALRKKPELFVKKLVRERSAQLYRSSEILERGLFNQFAPAIFTMAYQSLRTCISLGISKLYFVAREGISIRAVFELLVQNHPEFHSQRFQLRNLFCSRSSTACSRAKGTDTVLQLVSLVTERSNEFSIDSLLAAWNIDERKLNYAFRNKPDVRTREELCNLLSQNLEFRNAILEHLQRDREMLIAYFKQEEVPGEPCAFIDVGWSGTIQRNVEALEIGARVFGMYLGTNEKIEAQNFIGQIFSSSDYRTGAVHKSAPLAETLLSVSGLGTTISYESDGKEIRPVLSNNVESNGSIDSIRDRVFADYYPLFHELTRKYCIPTPALAEHARTEYFALVCRPDNALVRSIRDLEFSFDWGREDRHRLVRKFSVRELLHPLKLLATAWQLPWLFGTLKASHLGWLNTPISWMLGYEEQINRNRLRRWRRFLRWGG